MPSPSATQVTTNTTLNSCVVAAVDVRSCLSFDALWKAHPLNWVDPEPHPFKQQDGITPAYNDQCAIKMSITLQDGGLPMKTFRGAAERRTVAQLGRPVRAALRAEELAEWLIKALGRPTKYAPSEAYAAVAGKKGIVFFKDFWQRELPGSTAAAPRLESLDSRSGDHVDLWDGTTLPSLPAEAFVGERSYFTRSKGVWFWELK
jgi:hypothetical protein